MDITTVGIDLAKNVFQVHGVDSRGKLVLRKQLRRAEVALFLRTCAPAWLAWKRARVPTTGLEHWSARAYRALDGAAVCQTLR